MGLSKNKDTLQKLIGRGLLKLLYRAKIKFLTRNNKYFRVQIIDCPCCGEYHNIVPCEMKGEDEVEFWSICPKTNKIYLIGDVGANTYYWVPSYTIDAESYYEEG